MLQLFLCLFCLRRLLSRPATVARAGVPVRGIRTTAMLPGPFASANQSSQRSGLPMSRKRSLGLVQSMRREREGVVSATPPERNSAIHRSKRISRRSVVPPSHDVMPRQISQEKIRTLGFASRQSRQSGTGLPGMIRKSPH